MSPLGVLMSTSGMFSTSKRYHEYIGGYHEYIFGGDIMMRLGDTMSTLGDVQYIGGYHEYIGGCSVQFLLNKHPGIPLMYCTEHFPMYS